MTRPARPTAGLAVGVALSILLPAMMLPACGSGHAPGGVDALPGPLPEGVTFAEPTVSAPPAPTFELTLLDGAQVTGSDLWRDRPAVLYFFASWCGVCAEQQADITAMADSYDGVVAFLGIAGEDDPGALSDYLVAHDVPYAVGIDDTLEVWRSFAVAEPPLIAVVEPGGRLLRGWPGGAPASRVGDTLDSVIVARPAAR